MLWHRGAVNTVSFSSDNETIATASVDGTARRWWTDADRLWTEMREFVSGCLPPEFRERYLGESPAAAERAYRDGEQVRGHPRPGW